MTERPSAELHYGTDPGDKLELPRIAAEEGNDGFDVSKLLKQTGTVTFDPGFMNTAATTSAITYIDGDAGILRYRGYPIEQLAKHSSFLETSYLLIYGNLPTATELENFDHRIRRHTLLHEDLKGFFGGFPRDAHPMAVLQAGTPLSAPCPRSTRTPWTPSMMSRWNSPPSASWRSSRSSRPTPTRRASGSPCCTRTTP